MAKRFPMKPGIYSIFEIWSRPRQHIESPPSMRQWTLAGDKPGESDVPPEIKRSKPAPECPGRHRMKARARRQASLSTLGQPFGLTTFSLNLLAMPARREWRGTTGYGWQYPSLGYWTFVPRKACTASPDRFMDHPSFISSGPSRSQEVKVRAFVPGPSSKTTPFPKRPRLSKLVADTENRCNTAVRLCRTGPQQRNMWAPSN
jgi:hypothetical protein